MRGLVSSQKPLCFTALMDASAVLSFLRELCKPQSKLQHSLRTVRTVAHHHDLLSAWETAVHSRLHNDLTMSPENVAKKKSRRTSRACDYCHKRSIRCRPSGDGTNCLNCLDFRQPCTYQRQAKRRGVPPGARHTPAAHSSTPEASVPTRVPREPRHVHNNPSTYGVNQEESVKWTAPYVASQATIMDLVELYFEIVYPIFPFFHRPSFVRAISRGQHLKDQNLFAATLAVCALVSARIRDGAVTNPRWDITTLQETSSEVFYMEAAKQAVLGKTSDLNLMRSNAVLALAAIQNGNIRDMHLHLGRYHTIVAMDGLHEETNWPKQMGLIEVEERRRLFWSLYTLDIYSSVIWGGIIRCREQQSAVAYPTEIDDEMFNDNGIFSAALLAGAGQGPSPGRHGLQVSSTSWLSGWNFITDLYRVLEHALAHFRDRRARSRARSWLYDMFKENPGVSQISVLETVMQMYRDLPQCFKETPPVVFETKVDRFGFQAANITATLQLLRMVLFSASGASVADRCQIASEVINAFMAVPVAYHQAISAPLLHHIGGIGDILGSVLGEPLTPADYACVRSTLLLMAQLLANLDSVKSGTGAAERLRSQVAKIDEYMAAQQYSRGHPRQHRQSISSQMSPGLQTGAMDYPSYETMSNGGDASGLSPFQLPPEVVGDLDWLFDFAQPVQNYGLMG